MIGSPLNYFDAQTGGKQGMFQMGAALGSVNSPFSGPTQAIRSVLERARAWTDKQQDYEQKRQLLTDQSTAQSKASLDLAQQKRNMLIPRDAAGNPRDFGSFDPSLPQNKRQVGALTMTREPIVYQGVTVGERWRDPRAANIYEQFGLGGGGGDMPDMDEDIGGIPTGSVLEGRVPVTDGNGNQFTVPAEQLEEALAQGYKRM